MFSKDTIHSIVASIEGTPHRNGAHEVIDRVDDFHPLPGEVPEIARSSSLLITASRDPAIRIANAFVGISHAYDLIDRGFPLGLGSLMDDADPEVVKVMSVANLAIVQAPHQGGLARSSRKPSQRARRRRRGGMSEFCDLPGDQEGPAPEGRRGPMRRFVSTIVSRMVYRSLSFSERSMTSMTERKASDTPSLGKRAMMRHLARSRVL